MSDWLTIIIVVLIIGIILDGFRRARNTRRNEVRLSKNARRADKIFERQAQQTAAKNTDFPAGGARPVSPSGEGFNSADAEEPSEAPNDGIYSTEGGSPQAPQQTILDLNDPVPMLMDSVIDEAEQSNETSGAADEFQTDIEVSNTEFSDSLQEPESGDQVRDTEESILGSGHLEPKIGDISDIGALDEVLDEPADLNSEFDQSDHSHQAEKKERRSPFSAAAGYFQKEKHGSDTEEAQIQPVKASPQEIIVINVMAKKDEAFDGAALLDALTSQSLKYGDMGIFHRYLNNDGDAASLYSIANIIEPGRFDLASMPDSQTPGICLFLALPCAAPALSTYEDLIATARAIADQLDGELKDENRSALTKQTIEHGRQRVMEFERKHKLFK